MTTRPRLRQVVVVAGTFAIAWGPGPAPSRADTIELKNGQRIEGSLRETNATAMVIPALWSCAAERVGEAERAVR